MAHRRFVLLGLGGVIALVIVITISGLSNNLTYYLYPTEAVDQKADFPDGERFRLAGLVVKGSLSETDDVLRFEVTDGGATIDEVFEADTAIIRHDENYEVPDEGNYEAPDT